MYNSERLYAPHSEEQDGPKVDPPQKGEEDTTRKDDNAKKVDQISKIDRPPKR